MPAKDMFHDVVRNALVKEGWTITHDPLFIQFDEVEMHIDIGAEKIIAADKNGEQIAVEVKSFMNTSLIYAFHLAVGQFIDYRLALKEIEPHRTLYVAVPAVVYGSFFKRRLPQSVIKEYQIKIVVYDVEQEVIVQWIT
jgi:XisH protein